MKFAPNLFTAILTGTILLTTGAIAATKTFDGGSSGTGRTFAAGANWVGDGAPATGDDLIIGTGTLGGSMTTLYSTSSYLAMNSTAAAYTLAVQSLTFDNSFDQFPSAGIILRNSSATTAQASTLQFNTAGVNAFVVKSDANSAAPVVSVESRGTAAPMLVELNYTGQSNFLVENAGTLTFDGTNTTGGMISGIGGINKTGNGTLSLIGNINTFAGGLTISEGAVAVSLATRLGSSTVLKSDAVVINGGTLRFTDTATATSGANRGFQVGSSIGTIDVVESSKLVTISGVIGDVASQSGGLVKTGAGTLELEATNTFTGGLTITGGTVTAGSTLPLGSSSSVNSNAVVLNGGTLQITGSGTATSSANRGFRLGNNGGTIDIAGANRTIAIAGAMRNVLSQTGSLTKTGAGTLALTNATITYTGSTTVSAGTLLVNSPSSSSSTTVAAGARLGGTGSISGTATINGTLAPGSTLSTAPNPTATISFQNLGLSSSATLSFEITGGETLGSSDLVEVSGSLDLGNATLDLVQLGAYTVGNKVTLFSYDGDLTGTFAGLSNGEEFEAANGIWAINYFDTTPGDNGGTGSSFVTIIAIPEPSAALVGGLGLLTLVSRRRKF